MGCLGVVIFRVDGVVVLVVCVGDVNMLVC